MGTRPDLTFQVAREGAAQALEAAPPSLGKFTRQCLFWSQRQGTGTREGLPGAGLPSVISRLVWGGWQSAGARHRLLSLMCFHLRRASPVSSPWRGGFSELSQTGQCAQPHQDISANFSQNNLPQAAAWFCKLLFFLQGTKEETVQPARALKTGLDAHPLPNELFSHSPPSSGADTGASRGEGALAWVSWTWPVADLETPSLLEDGTAQ